MAVTKTDFKGAKYFDVSSSVAVAGVNSSPFVLVADTSLAHTTAHMDPLQIIAGADANGGTIRPVVVAPRYKLLHLVNIWTYAGGGVLSPAPTIKVFGLLPPEDPSVGTALPHQDDADFGNISRVTATTGNVWIPLYHRGIVAYAAADHALALTATEVSQLDTGPTANPIRIGLEKVIDLNGARKVMCTVSVASVITGGTNPGAQIFGWFSA